MSHGLLNDFIHYAKSVQRPYSCDQRATAEAQCHLSCQVMPRGFAKPASLAVIGVLLFTFKQSLHSVLCSSLSRHGFNGRSLACSGSHYFGRGHDFSIKERVLKESTEADGRITVELLHHRLEMVIYPLWPGLRDHRRHTVSQDDPSELSASHLTDGTNSSRCSLPCILEKSYSGPDNEGQHLPSLSLLSVSLPIRTVMHKKRCVSFQLCQTGGCKLHKPRQDELQEPHGNPQSSISFNHPKVNLPKSKYCSLTFTLPYIVVS